MQPAKATTRVVVLDDRRRAFDIRAGEETSAAVLTRRLIDRRIPRSEQWRYDPGRGISLDSIASAIIASEYGSMCDLTDLGDKTIETDPNLISVLERRFGQLEACEYTLRPASGEGIDREKAKCIADAVTKELRLLPSPANWGEEKPRKNAGLAPLIGCLEWALWDGRAAVEKVWGPVQPTPARKVRWAIHELPWIHPRRISFGPRREMRLVEAHQRAANFAAVGIDLTAVPGKFIGVSPQIFRDYPEREGYCRRALYWSFFKRVGVRERAVLGELFSRPYKILEVDAEARATEEELEQADEDVEALGAATQVRLPKGVKLELPWPHPESGGVHKEQIDYADLQNQLMFLGQPMTTANGSSRSQGEVHERQQNIYLAKDGRRMCGWLQADLVTPIVELNAVPFELRNDDEIGAYCPTLEIHTESEPDRKAETERLNAVIDRGIPVAVQTVYEVSGFRPPEPGEQVIVGSNATAKVYDSLEAAQADEARRQQEAAARAAALKEALGVPPGQAPSPPGAPKPDDQTNEKGAERSEQEEPQEAAAPPPSSPAAGAAPKVALTTAETLELDPRIQIATIFQRRARNVVLKWLSSISDALDGKQPYEIEAAVAAIDIDETDLAALLEEAAMRSAMVAAIETAHEVGTSDERRQLAMATPTAAMDFVRAPYEKAAQAFMEKRAVPRELFDTMNADAKRRAFTMAGALSQDMLEVVQQELATSIATGSDLRRFKSQLRGKFDELGWTSPAPAHLETVFRTNTLAAYGDARMATLRQPEAIKRRPYLMFVATQDDRTRETHAAAHGKMMRADDSAWERVRPPCGFNCRCTVRSLRLEDATERAGGAIRYNDRDPENKALPDSYEIVTGSDPVWDGLPDQGFRSLDLPSHSILLAEPPKPPTEGEEPKAPPVPPISPLGHAAPPPAAAIAKPDPFADPGEPTPERGGVLEGFVETDELEMLVGSVVDQHFEWVERDEARHFVGWIDVAQDGTIQGARFEATDGEEPEPAPKPDPETEPEAPAPSANAAPVDAAPPAEKPAQPPAEPGAQPAPVDPEVAAQATEPEPDPIPTARKDIPRMRPEEGETKEAFTVRACETACALVDGAKKPEPKDDVEDGQTRDPSTGEKPAPPKEPELPEPKTPKTDLPETFAEYAGNDPVKPEDLK